MARYECPSCSYVSECFEPGVSFRHGNPHTAAFTRHWRRCGGAAGEGLPAAVLQEAPALHAARRTDPAAAPVVTAAERLAAHDARASAIGVAVRAKEAANRDCVHAALRAHGRKAGDLVLFDWFERNVISAEERRALIALLVPAKGPGLSAAGVVCRIRGCAEHFF